MLFSVCIPVYNTSKYLDECLASVLCQTEQDYEIVLVDDGSTDGSGEICDRYAARYPHIRVIHKENEGLMMTRRRAFREARGDYFLCLDSDDYWLSDRVLELVREMIQKNCCDLLLFNYIAGKEDPSKNQNIVLFDHPDGYIFEGDAKKELYRKLLIGRDLNAIWAKVPAKTVVDVDVDYTIWKKDICRGEDMFQTYPMLTKAKRIGYIKEPLIHYRWTPSSISNNPKLKFYKAFRTIYRREEEYLPKWDMDEGTVRKARLRRIPNILGILTTGYYACKHTDRISEWKDFIREVSADPFFREMLPWQEKHGISPYYRLLGSLIRSGNISGLIRVLDVYRWYSDHIKRKK